MSDNDSDDCLILPDPDLSDFTPIKEETENLSSGVSKEHSSISDTETVSTIDLCQRKKKHKVSLSTYVARSSKDSLKPHLDKLNSKSSVESVDLKLSREGKRRKIEKKVDKKVDSTKIINLFKTGKTVAEIADKFGISKKCAQQIVSNNSSSSASAGPSIPMRRGVPVFTDPGSLTALRSESPPNITPSEIREKISENELKLGRRKSMKPDEIVAKRDSPPKVGQKKYQCKHCPYAVFNCNSTDDHELNNHYNKCMGIAKRIIGIKEKMRDRTAAHEEALDSHFKKENGVYICYYCLKKCEQWQDITIAVAKYLHLQLYHKNKTPEEKRISNLSDIQKIITSSSSASPRLCIRNTSSMPLSKKLKTKVQASKELDPDFKWQRPMMKKVPNFLKKSNSAPPNSDGPCSSRSKTLSAESSDELKNKTPKEKHQTNRRKRKSSSSSEEDLRRVKRRSIPRPTGKKKAVSSELEKRKSLPLSTDSSSRESSPDKSSSKKKDKTPNLSASDLRRIEEKLDFVKRQYELVSEGYSKKHKCRHCESYFKNCDNTLRVHLRDKCAAFWKNVHRRRERNERRLAQKNGENNEQTTLKSKQTEESSAQNEEAESSKRRRLRATSSGSEGRGPLLFRSSSTDDEVSAAALAEEERENTLGKEQSAKILVYKIIRELISEGLLIDQEKITTRCVYCSRGQLNLASCQQQDMWQWECTTKKCPQKVPIRNGSVIDNIDITLDSFLRLYKEYKAGTSVEITAAKLKLPVPDVKKIYDSIHKEVAAEKTKVKAEPLELLDFSTRSGTPDISVDIPTSSPESSPPKQVKKANYRQSKPFECGVVVVKTEPMEESERKQVFKLDPDGRLCNVHTRTEYSYGEQDRCYKVALFNNTLCSQHDNMIRLKELQNTVGNELKPKVSSKRSRTNGASTSRATSSKETSADDDDEDDLPAPFGEDDESSEETEDQPSNSNLVDSDNSADKVADKVTPDNITDDVPDQNEEEEEHSLQIDENATPDSEEEVALLAEPAETENRSDQQEREGGDVETDDEGIDIVAEEEEEEGESGISSVESGSGDLDHTISPTVRPTQTPPTTDRGTDPHLPSPFTSPSVEAETLFPRITDEVKDTPISLFPDARLRDFNLDAWTERCVRELKEANQELSGSLLLEKIMEKFEEASLNKCLNSLWMLVITLEKGTLKKFSAFVAMLHYLQMRASHSPKRARMECEKEIERALRTLDIFTLLVLHRLSLKSDLLTLRDVTTSNRICQQIRSKSLEVNADPEEHSHVIQHLSKTYGTLHCNVLYNLRHQAHEQRNILAIVCIECTLQDRYNKAHPIQKIACIRQYLNHLQSLKGDDQLWPDVSELRSYEVNSVLRRIAGELYLAGSKGTSSSPHSLLSQLVMNLNGEEKTLLTTDLHRCGLVPAATPSITGVIGEVSSSQDQVIGVETAESGAQVNLYESSWTPGPEFDFRLLGSLDGDRSDGVIIQQVVKLEKATTLNDIARDENNMHIASLESSLKRRQALKIELDNRDKRVKRYRSRVLANRDTNSEHRDSNTGGGTGNG